MERRRPYNLLDEIVLALLAHDGLQLHAALLECGVLFVQHLDGGVFALDRLLDARVNSLDLSVALLAQCDQLQLHVASGRLFERVALAKLAVVQLQSHCTVKADEYVDAYGLWLFAYLLNVLQLLFKLLGVGLGDFASGLRIGELGPTLGILVACGALGQLQLLQFVCVFVMQPAARKKDM